MMSSSIAGVTPFVAILRRRAWSAYLKLLILSALIAALYAGVVANLLVSCWNEPAQSQGILILPLTAYLAWIRREVPLSRPAAPDNRGLLVIAGAVGLYVLGVLGADLFLPRLSLVVLIAGVLWTFWG